MEDFQKKKEEPKRVVPEFVYIDDESDYAKSQKTQYYQTFQWLEKKKFSPAIRIMSFSAAIIMAIAGALLLVALLVVALANVFTFFQIDTLNERLKSLWKLLEKIAVFFVGFLMAVLSPMFGFGIIVLYFMLRKEKLSGFMMGRIFKS